jgi:hypothetical protein
MARNEQQAVKTLVAISLEHGVSLADETFEDGMAVLTRLSREVAIEFGLTDQARARVKDHAIPQLLPQP